jgi:hypothetical protein
VPVIWKGARIYNETLTTRFGMNKAIPKEDYEKMLSEKLNELGIS